MQGALKVGESLKEQFSEALQVTPRISVDNAVIFAQNASALELVLMQRDALVRHEMSETWMHSTKEFDIEAVFTARAGMNLRDLFMVNVEDGGKRVVVRLPRVSILSISMGDLRILRDEDGAWNKLTAKDRERGIKELQKLARREFQKTDLLMAARAEAKKRVTELVQTTGARVEIEDTVSESSEGNPH